jgi:predicted dehydrogenase
LRNDRLTIAVIGAGVIGRKHAETVMQSPFWRLVGIAEPAQTGKDYSERLGVSWHHAASDLLDEVKPDAAVIATPNQTHREMALACIERRIPVIVEKPIAGTLDDAMAIVQASERTGVPVLVGHHRRYNSIVRFARAFIGEGLLGRLTNVSVLYTFYKPSEYFDVAWRRRPDGGPVLINLIHEIDFIRHVCGEIESVQAFTSNGVRGFEVEDAAAVILRLASGALVTLSLSDSAVTPWSWDLATREVAKFPPQAAPVQTHFLSGTEGSLTLPTLEYWCYRGEKSWLQPMYREVKCVEQVDPYVEQLRHFYRVVRREEAPQITAADGALTLRATLAVREAARSAQ